MDFALSQKSNLSVSEDLNERIKSDLLDLIKQKRDKHRSEIRSSQITSELNTKRYKLSEDFMKQPIQQYDISQENRHVFYEEVSFLIKTHKTNSDIMGLINTLNKLKKLMSEDLEYCLKYIKKYEIPNEIIEFLNIHYDEHLELQIQTLWNLSNIICLDVDDNYIIGFLKCYPQIIDNLIRFLLSNNNNLLHNTLWNLGNISGKSNDLRHQLFELDIIEKIIDVFEGKQRDIKTLTEALWLISNLCMGSPYPPFEETRKFLPLLKKCLTLNNASILEYTMWTLSYLSDGDNSQVKEILNLGMTAKLISLTTHQLKEIKFPAIRTIGNLLSSDDSDTEILIENGLFDYFIILLDDENRIVRKEVGWGISNILACNEDIIQQICSHKLIDKIFNHCFYDEFMIREDLIMGLANAVTKANKNEMMLFIEKEIFTLFLQMLEFTNSNLISIILKGLDPLLDFFKEYKINWIDEKSLKDKLDSLQYHPDQGIYEKAQILIDKFFITE